MPSQHSYSINRKCNSNSNSNFIHEEDEDENEDHDNNIHSAMVSVIMNLYYPLESSLIRRALCNPLSRRTLEDFRDET